MTACEFGTFCCGMSAASRQPRCGRAGHARLAEPAAQAVRGTRRHGPLLVTGFNTLNHPVLEGHAEYCVKASCGGINLFFDAAFYHELVRDCLVDYGWDWALVNAMRSVAIRSCALRPRSAASTSASMVTTPMTGLMIATAIFPGGGHAGPGRFSIAPAKRLVGQDSDPDVGASDIRSGSGILTDGVVPSGTARKRVNVENCVQSPDHGGKQTGVGSICEQSARVLREAAAESHVDCFPKGLPWVACQWKFGSTPALHLLRSRATRLKGLGWLGRSPISPAPSVRRSVRGAGAGSSSIFVPCSRTAGLTSITSRTSSRSRRMWRPW